MRRRRSFLLGLAFGLAVGAFGTPLFRQALPTKTYTVHAISSHFPSGTANSQTTLAVYREGRGGHVMEVNCAFPPGFSPSGDPGTDKLWNAVEEAIDKGGSIDEVNTALASAGHNTNVAELRQRVAGWRVVVTRTVDEEFLGGVTFYLCARA